MSLDKGASSSGTVGTAASTLAVDVVWGDLTKVKWIGRAMSRGRRGPTPPAATRLERCFVDPHFVGTRIGAPLLLTKNTTNFADAVSLALRATTCTSSAAS